MEETALGDLSTGKFQERPRQFLARAILFWMRRYGPQDLLAGMAAVLGCLALKGSIPNQAFLGTTCAVIESIVFYVVAFARQQGRRNRGTGHAQRDVLVRLLREYGPAEFADLVVRPASMTLAMTLTKTPLLGVALGSVVADLVFYTVAALAYRKRALRNNASRVLSSEGAALLVIESHRSS